MVATMINHILFGTSKLLRENRLLNFQLKILRSRICCSKAAMSKMYKHEKYVFCYFVKNRTMKRKQVFPALVIFFMVVSHASGQLNTNEVGQRTLAYVDNSRNRKLTTEVWYPTLEKTSPDDASPFV